MAGGVGPGRQWPQPNQVSRIPQPAAVRAQEQAAEQVGGWGWVGCVLGLSAAERGVGSAVGGRRRDWAGGGLMHSTRADPSPPLPPGHLPTRKQPIVPEPAAEAVVPLQEVDMNQVRSVGTMGDDGRTKRWQHK